MASAVSGSNNPHAVSASPSATADRNRSAAAPASPSRDEAHAGTTSSTASASIRVTARRSPITRGHRTTVFGTGTAYHYSAVAAA